MNVTIHSSGFEATPAIEEYVQRRLGAAFGRVSAPIRRVVVRMSDVNADRGGVDKRCQVQVQIVRAPDVLIEDTHSDMYLAISRAVDRAGRTTQRRVGKARRLSTRGPATGGLGESDLQRLSPQLRDLLRLPADSNPAGASW